MNLRPLVFAALCVSCSCASAPKINYYALGMDSSDGAQTTVNLTVERLRTTEALSRSQIMIRASATRIEYFAVDHWAGSLGELVQHRLATEFGPTVPGRKTFKVSGKITAFEQVDRPEGRQARVKMDIVIRDPSAARALPPLLEKTYEVSRGVARPGLEALTDALSRCVDQIAAEIATDVSPR